MTNQNQNAFFGHFGQLLVFIGSSTLGGRELCNFVISVTAFLFQSILDVRLIISNPIKQKTILY